jgi:putative ABC transport system permease protein
MFLYALTFAIKGIKRRWKFTIPSIITLTTIIASTTALIYSIFHIKEKINREVRKFGANIIVEPASGQFLLEEDIFKIKSIFWRHNILSVTPYLEIKSELKGIPVNIIGTWIQKEETVNNADFKGGIRIEGNEFLLTKGNWINDYEETTVMITEALSQKFGLKIGDTVSLYGRSFEIKGIVISSPEYMFSIIFSLATLQKLTGLKGYVSKITVNALTVPIDEFGKRDPSTMSPKEYEKWYCTPYVTSVSKQIEEVVRGSKAKPLWQHVEYEAIVVKKLSIFFTIFSIFLIFVGSIVSIVAFEASFVQRLKEILLMKALGRTSKVLLIILFEELAKGVCGIFGGFILSIYFLKIISKLFYVEINMNVEQFLFGMLIFVLIEILSLPFPIWKIRNTHPAEVMRMK